MPHPFADLTAEGDFELTIHLNIDLERYGDPTAFVVSTYAKYAIEAGGKDGRWRLRTRPIVSEDEAGSVLGTPLVDLVDQTTEPGPVALLRALLTGKLI